MKRLVGICFGLLSNVLVVNAGFAKQSIDVYDNVYFITEQLITPLNHKTQWNWSVIENIDDGSNEKPSNQYSDDKKIYTLSKNIVDIKYIDGKGNRRNPYIIHFNSTVRGLDKNQHDKLWELSQIVNTANIEVMKSNCNLRSVGISEGDGESEGSQSDNLESQTFYKWTRAGSKPLYIAEMIGNGIVITGSFNSWSYKSYIVVPHTKYFSQAGIWNTNGNGKKMRCYFK